MNVDRSALPQLVDCVCVCMQVHVALSKAINVARRRALKEEEGI